MGFRVHLDKQIAHISWWRGCVVPVPAPRPATWLLGRTQLIRFITVLSILMTFHPGNGSRDHDHVMPHHQSGEHGEVCWLTRPIRRSANLDMVNGVNASPSCQWFADCSFKWKNTRLLNWIWYIVDVMQILIRYLIGSLWHKEEHNQHQDTDIFRHEVSNEWMNDSMNEWMDGRTDGRTNELAFDLGCLEATNLAR